MFSDPFRKEITFPNLVPNVTFELCVVEGNIGSGKTSFLSQFSGLAGVETLAEPVERWWDLNGTGDNLLQLMYEDPARSGRHRIPFSRKK